jgi:glutathione S-transferase
LGLIYKIRNWQTHWFYTGLSALEDRLRADGRSGTFCLHDQPTIADICVASIAVTMNSLGLAFPNLPNVTSIVTHCMALDAFSRADPRFQQRVPAV